jgi:hypothetical protein
MNDATTTDDGELERRPPNLGNRRPDPTLAQQWLSWPLRIRYDRAASGGPT